MNDDFQNEIDDEISENVSEESLPAVIRAELSILSDFSKKKDEAKSKAEEAKSKADEMNGVKVFKTKDAVEKLQDAAKALGEAQVLASEAQEMSFEYQKKLTKVSKYLFGLGVTNMSMNRSVVKELRASLEGSEMADLDEMAQKELENVISQLVAQEDLMFKQEKLADTIDAIDDVVTNHSDRIDKYEATTARFNEMLEVQIKKDEEHDRLFAEKNKVDYEQSLELQRQQKKDEEHDSKIDLLEMEIRELKNKISDIDKIDQYKRYMLISTVISIFAIIIAILGCFI